MKHKIIIAHRGASADAHENTVEAFKKAIELGADMVEMDVRRTRNGVLAVYHDEFITNKKVSGFTYKELNNIVSWENFLIPTLAQALNSLAGKLPVQIEIKGRGWELQAAEEASCLRPEDFYIISFNLSSLKKIKRVYPKIRTGLILGDAGKRLWQARWYLSKKSRVFKYVDAVSLSWHLWQAGWVKKLPEKLPVFVWTVDDMELFKKIWADGRVAGITTNTLRPAVDLKSKL